MAWRISIMCVANIRMQIRLGHIQRSEKLTLKSNSDEAQSDEFM
jgi:hypothetical protein